MLQTGNRSDEFHRFKVYVIADIKDLEIDVPPEKIPLETGCVNVRLSTLHRHDPDRPDDAGAHPDDAVQPVQEVGKNENVSPQGQVDLAQFWKQRVTEPKIPAIRVIFYFFKKTRAIPDLFFLLFVFSTNS